MTKKAVVRPDAFSATLSELLVQVSSKVHGNMDSAVRKACKTGVASAKGYAASAKGSSDGAPSWKQGRALKVDNDYTSGFKSRVTKDARSVSGTIGNKTKPGLVHLLELGHARIGGGRVQSYKHIEPAADDAFNTLESLVRVSIQDALEEV